LVSGKICANYKKILRHHVAVALIFFIVLGATIFLFIKIPTSFVPQEDEGYFMVSVQLPPGASLDRTTKVTDSLGKILTNYPQVSTYLTINGMSIMGGGTESNSATLFVMLKNWKERKTKSSSSFSIVDKFNIQCSSIQDAQIFAVSPSAIPGLGQSGGLQVEIEDINNLGTIQLQEMLNVLMSTYYKVPQISMLNTQFQANTPKYYLNVDRDKLQMMGISISDFFNTLSYYMGSAYVNDYIELGRIFQVNIEASAESRRMINDVLKLSVKNSTGNLVPFSSFVTPVEQIGINNISRYNLYTAASVIVITNPKYSSMEGISAMDKLLNESIGNEFGYEWTSVAYQELEAGSSIIWIFILAIIIVILVLSAQYESLKNPIAVLMGVPFAILGALLGMIVMSLSISVYTQIGIILLIALSSKNAILIVQFAIDYYNEGKSAEEAAIEAGRVRFRPILMTSFAFILGVLPLMFASGAGAESRIYLGTAVVFGMLFNTIFGTLFIPSYYVLMNYKRKK
jgi:Cation/multidrug efflux pump